MSSSGRTSSSERLAELLAAHRQAWQLGDPVEPERLQAVAGRLPDEVTALYGMANGGHWGDEVVIFPFAHLVGLLDDVALHGRLPSAVFFGGNGGDDLFFVDADGTLGRGPGAVYQVGMGSLSPDDAIPVGASLAELAAAVARGERPWEGQTLGRLRIQETLAALKTRADVWQARPGSGSSALVKTRARTNVGLPPLLAALLLLSDGSRFARRGITLRPATGIEGVAELPASPSGVNPGALWFADADDGTRYAVGTGVSAELPRDIVISVPPGRSATEGVRMGSLRDVLLGWLEG